MKRLLVFLLCAFSVFLSCNDDQIGIALTSAEVSMNDNPESALKILESLDKDIISTRKQKAKYALLYSIALNKTNVIDHVEAGFEVLYGNNCKTSEKYWLEVCPKMYRFLRPAMTEVLTDNVEMAKKGIVGRYGNADITIENLLATDETSCYNQLRTEHAVAFDEQIDKVEAYRPQDAFEDALKGLYVFGALVTRPNEIVVLKTNL